MRNAPIEGQDITEALPHNGLFLLAGIVRSPRTLVTLFWDVDGASGSTTCEAWKGQHEIDCLTRAGYQIRKVSLSD